MKRRYRYVIRKTCDGYENISLRTLLTLVNKQAVTVAHRQLRRGQPPAEIRFSMNNGTEVRIVRLS